MFYIRLDDASDFMDIVKWEQMERLLDKYNISPLVGIIPFNRDVDIISKYQKDAAFWDRVRKWQAKGWSLALHGCYHVYHQSRLNLNPVNKVSEFADLPLSEQKKRIKLGVEKLKSEGVQTKIFFAPSHTFDSNTIEALKQESDIRIISDTVATNIYNDKDIIYLPLQLGRFRPLPFQIVGASYHPNTMTNEDFNNLEKYIQKYSKQFIDLNKLDLMTISRKRTILDRILQKIYFIYRHKRHKLEKV